MKFNTYVSSVKSLNIILYGPPKARKTTWAGGAAECGFTTVLIDAEDGLIVLKQLTAEAKENIWAIPCADGASSFNVVAFMGCLFKRDKFVWAVNGKRQVISASGVADNDTYILIQKTALNNNYVLVLDSWSALVSSLRGKIFFDMGISIDEAKKLEWSDYGSGNQVLTNFLNAWRGLKCHKIIIGHEEFREKNIKIGTVETKRTRGQIISFSGNHSATLPAFFDEVIYFYGKEGGFGKPPKYMLSTAFNTDRDGGGRIIPSGEYDFNEYLFSRVMLDSGISPPTSTNDDNTPFITELDPDAAREFFTSNSAAKPALVTPTATQVAQTTNAFPAFTLGKK